MKKITSGKYVAIAYDLYASPIGQPETQVHIVEESEPERFIFGVTPGLIPALAQALEGLAQGDTFDVSVTPEEGIPFNSDDIVTLDSDLFFDKDGKIDSRIKVGAKVPMITGDGYQITGTVLEMIDSKVKMDFNHPLAGQALHFKNGKVVTVRDATPEELHPSCGGCGGGNCGKGCGGGSENGCCGGCN